MRKPQIYTEIFIPQLIREPLDYTQWQRERYADVSVGDFNKKAVEYARNNLRGIRKSTRKMTREMA